MHVNKKEVFIMKAAVVKKQGILPVIEEIDKPTSTSEGDLILRD